MTRRLPVSALAVVLGAATLVLGCGRRETPEAVRARSTAAFRRAQIEGLEKLIAQAERGELVTKDQIAIGVSEDAARSLLNASLPIELRVADRLLVRIESAEPIFRGSQAGLVFRAKVTSVDAPGAHATLELGGHLDLFRLEHGKLTSKVALLHFVVRDASLGDLAANVLDGLVRANLRALQDAIPPVEIPVQLEESIKIAGLSEGAVVARPGALPLEIAVSQVLPANERLWVLLRAKAGPWQAAPSAEETKPVAK